MKTKKQKIKWKLINLIFKIKFYIYLYKIFKIKNKKIDKKINNKKINKKYN